MPIRKILAPLSGGDRDATVMASAFAAGKPFNAHVTALFVRPDPSEALPFFGEGVSGAVVQEIIDAAKDAADKAAEDARTAVLKAASEAGAEIVERPRRAERLTCTWRETQGNFADRVTEASRLVDLVVFGPIREGDKPGLTDAFEAALIETGRPVLLSAQVPPRNFARRIAVGWDRSVPAAHALTAAMPYLARAEAVELLTVQAPPVDPHIADEAREYLAMHGIECTERVVDPEGRNTGQALLDAASQAGAGLLVMGGYGHSRLTEFFLGGVTRHVVSHADLPVLMVH